MMFRYKEEIYRAWIKFTLPWLVFVTTITFFAPIHQSLYQTDWKAVAAYIFTGLFILVSILIIGIKSRQGSKKNN